MDCDFAQQRAAGASRFGIALLPSLLMACGVASALGCGGISRSDGSVGAGAGSESPPKDCVEEGCAGLPCEVSADCPDGSLHYKACLPNACGLPSVCNYASITAGTGAKALTCSCEGQVESGPHGIGSPPSVFAYPFAPEYQYLCECAGEEICERSVCVGARCDPNLAEAPGLSAFVAGAGLALEDGLSLIAFDAYAVTPEGRLVIGRGIVSRGAIEFPLATTDARLTLLLDANGDGACNPGERLLPYFRELVPLEGLLRFVPVSDQEPLPCEARLPAR